MNLLKLFIIIVGLRGYVAPEKLMEAYASMMSDVFSFGIIIIEIITGRRVSPFVDLPEWVTYLQAGQEYQLLIISLRTSQLAHIVE
jgi:serine/threonine protein kinase